MEALGHELGAQLVRGHGAMLEHERRDSFAGRCLPAMVRRV
jgi:hypothetical protein